MRAAIRLARRLGGRNAIAVGVLLAIAFWALESRARLGHVVHQVRGLPAPAWPWIVLAAAATAGSYWWSAVSLQVAAGRRLPMGRTMLVQLAAGAANRITPGGLGGAAVNGRFLTTQGSSAGEAGAAISLTAIAHVAVAVGGVFLLAPTLTKLPWVRSTLALPVWRSPWLIVALVPTAAATWFAARLLRAQYRRGGRFARFVTEARTELVSAAHQPWRLLALLATTAAVRASLLVALLGATWAFDGDIPDWRVAMVFLVGVPAAEAIPTPGGLGTVDAVLVAGLVGVGGDTVAAVVAAVVVFRLLTFWAPIVPGAIASGLLRRSCAL